MDRQVARHADQRRRHAGEVAPAGREVEPLEVGMGGEQLLQRLVLEDRNPPGDLADLARGSAVHLGHLAQRAPETEAVVVRHHRRLGPGIGAEDVGQHPVALVPGKVEVDVGRILALGIEEALEEEPGAEGLDVGDAETVAHDRVGHRAAAAVGGAVLHDVLHHQEVVGEALLADDAELALQPLAGDWRDGAVAPLGAGVGERAEPLERLVGLGQARRHDPADRDAIPAALGDDLGLAHRLGAVGEEADDVVGGAEPGVAGGGGRAQTLTARPRRRPALTASYSDESPAANGGGPSPRDGP